MSGRPEILFPLFAELETLEGVGPKVARTMSALDVEKPRDLLFTLPYSGVDRRKRQTVQGADLPGVVTVEVTVDLRGTLLEMEGAILEATNAVGCCATEEALRRFDTDGGAIRVGAKSFL